MGFVLLCSIYGVQVMGFMPEGIRVMTDVSPRLPNLTLVVSEIGMEPSAAGFKADVKAYLL